jgi:hypothetical protein
MKRYGIFAEDLKVKVTNEIKEGKLIKIPCQMWFKIKDKEYCYEWIDVCLSQANFPLANGIKKGDKITVSGQMTMSEYNGKKQWTLWATELKSDKPVGEDVKHEPINDDVPF